MPKSQENESQEKSSAPDGCPRKRVRYNTLDSFFKISDIAAFVMAFCVTVCIRLFGGSAAMGIFSLFPKIVGGTEYYAMPPSKIEFAWFMTLNYMIPACVVLYGLYALLGLYRGHRFIRPKIVFNKIFIANLILTLITTSVLYFRSNMWHPRGFFAFMFALTFIFTLIGRSIVSEIWRHLSQRRASMQVPAVLVGNTRGAAAIQSIIADLHPYGIYVARRIRTPQKCGTYEIVEAIRETGAQLLILGDDKMSVAHIMECLEVTHDMSDVAVKILSPKLSAIGIKAREQFDIILGVPFVHFESVNSSDKSKPWRVAFSRALAAVLLVALLPLSIPVALIVWLYDRGPVLFKQNRYGVRQKEFLMYKFRTMAIGADKMQSQLEKDNDSAGGLFKVKNDPRITPFGRFLRKYSIDELPQLINIIRGEMRFVGPRPLPKRDVMHYSQAWHYFRHYGEPGLTCLWQISGRSEIGFDDMCILDIYYLRNRSWMLDLSIFLRTIGVVITGKGAY